MSKLFLVSTSNQLAFDHLKDTLDGGHNREDIVPFLNDADESLLEKKTEPIRIWGTKRGEKDVNLSAWEKMEQGDWCLFYRQKQYIRVGRVYHKVTDENLAEQLWGRDEDGEVWELIYFIDNWQKIDVPKDIVHDYLGYKENFTLQGFLCPTSGRQDSIRARIGSIENFIETITTENLEDLKSQDEIENEIIKSVKKDVERERGEKSDQEWKRYLENKAKELAEESSPRTVVNKTKSTERNPRLYEYIKQRHDYKCQVDESHRFETQSGGYYAEVHHIVPLSECQEERIENILVLCPTCHKKFHYGSKRVLKNLIQELPEPQKSIAKECHNVESA